MAIEADHYREEVECLKKDPIVIAMADELWDAPQGLKDKFWNHDAEPTYIFMIIAGGKYRDAGGAQRCSIGGVAKAITALHKERVENAHGKN